MTNRTSILSEEEIKRRLPIWEALSELFVDTELNEASYQYIAKTIKQSDFEPKEIDHILWYEVLPGVGDNLRCITGEWSGFEQGWLKERILKVLSSQLKPFKEYGTLSVKSLVDITLNELSKVCQHLPSEYSDLLLEDKRNTSLFYQNNKSKWR